MRIEIYDRQHNVRAVGRGLAVADELIVVDAVKVKAPIEVQRPVPSPNRIHPRDEVPKGIGTVEVAVANFVLLGVEVLLAARLARHVLAQLVGRAIDAVVSAQRRGEHEPDLESGPAASLQVFVENVRRIRPGVGTEVLPPLGSAKLGEVFGELVFRVAPGEVRVRLAEAELCQPMHHARPSERFRQKDRLRMLLLYFADHPFPKAERLGVWIVDAKNAHARLDPVLEDAPDLFPQLCPARAPEIERVDVLVLLRRVLRVLDAAVDTAAEPLRMLAHVGMVGSALQRDVERDVDVELPRPRDQPLEILKRAQGRVNGLVAALLRADGPGAARIVRGRHQRIVAPLAFGAPDGMDRWKMQHVETERSDAWQVRRTVGERSMPRCSAGAREQLIPAAVARALRFYNDLERRVRRGRKAAVGAGVHEVQQFLAEGKLAPRAELRFHGERSGNLAQALRGNRRYA